MSRAISTYVGTLIISLIVLGIGTFVYMYALNVLNVYKDMFNRELIEQSIAAKQEVSGILMYIKGNNITMVIATGSSALRLLAIYVNGTPVKNCFVRIGDSTIRIGSKGVDLPPNSLITIICVLPSTSRIAFVKIVFEHGEVYGVALPI